MAKITRVLQKIFGATASSGEFGIIGSKSSGSPTTTKDLAAMQTDPKYLEGLIGITSDQGTSRLPYTEDMNSLFYLATSMIKYLYQSGVPEWLSTENYYADVSIVLDDGFLWKAITGNDSVPNTGNKPADNRDKWAPVDGIIDVRSFGAKGDGVTDDSAAFQNAADYALSSGNKNLYVPVGQYNCVEVDIDSIRIYGEGTIKKLITGVYGIQLLGDSPEVDGLKFEPYVISGQPNADIKLGDGCNNPYIHNCKFNSPIGGRIYSAITSADDPSVGGGDFPYTTNITQARITNNIFVGYTRPIYLFCLDGYSIVSNSFKDSSFDAIRIREIIGNGLITNNLFQDVGDVAAVDDQTRDAIDTAFSGYQLTIANNIIKGTHYSGIDVKGTVAQGEGYGSSEVIITGNQISATRYSGIAITGVGKFLICNNVIRGCNTSDEGVGFAAIYVKETGTAVVPSNIQISNNIVEYNNARGISVEESTAFVDIESNHCINNKDTGINYQHGADSYGIISRNTCVNRPAETLGNEQLIGLSIASSSASSPTLIIEGNILKDNVNFQFNLSGSNYYQNSIFSFKNNYEEGTNAYGVGTGFERFQNKEPRVRWGDGSTPSSTAGDFNVGDIIYDIAPVAGGKIGMVCVTAGSPGTWKDFGVIDV